jgi:hypothetical protein
VERGLESRRRSDSTEIAAHCGPVSEFSHGESYDVQQCTPVFIHWWGTWPYCDGINRNTDSPIPLVKCKSWRYLNVTRGAP